VVNSRATRCSGWFALGRHSLDPRRIASHGPWRSTGTILLVIGGLTVVYAVAQKLARALVLQTRVQFVIDVLLGDLG